MEEKGYLSLFLHGHLPFVKHPEYNDFLEEDWFFEAITETYIPLLELFDRLCNEGIPFNITISLSGTLTTMMQDQHLQDRYIRHLNKLIEFARCEVERTEKEPQYNKTARHYYEELSHAKYVFLYKYQKNLVNGFKKFMDRGVLEIVPVTATHGFLPAYTNLKEAVYAQIRMAKEEYERLFQRSPKGIWLAECGYIPGDDELLADFGFRYFIVDSHGILLGNPKPRYGIYAPIYTKNGVAAFGRDVESSEQVWSSEVGYPGHPNYREFHRDAGYDLDYDYVERFLHEDGVRRNTGIKYYRITDKDDKKVEKQPYDPEVARNLALEHGANFVFNREQQVGFLNDYMGKAPVVFSPYDMELFGHWWYEGPYFLEGVFRTAAMQKNVKLTTPYKYLLENPRNQVVTPCASTWGAKGYSDVWVDGSNEWTYRHIHNILNRMVELSNHYNVHEDSLLKRALNQSARIALLSMTSCWQFIMFTDTMVEYAEKRIRDHVREFNKLYYEIKYNNIDEEWLKDLEERYWIFPGIDYKIFASDNIKKYSFK